MRVILTYRPPGITWGLAWGMLYRTSTMHLVRYHDAIGLGLGLTMHKHRHKRSPGLGDGLQDAVCGAPHISLPPEKNRFLALQLPELELPLA